MREQVNNQMTNIAICLVSEHNEASKDNYHHDSDECSQDRVERLSTGQNIEGSGIKFCVFKPMFPDSMLATCSYLVHPYQRDYAQAYVSPNLRRPCPAQESQAEKILYL